MSRPQRRLLLALLSASLLALFALYRIYTPRPSAPPDEIFGLLHFVTSPDEAGRHIIAPGDPDPARENGTLVRTVAPDTPVELAWYALGSDGGWEQRLRVLRERSPLVVFSKSHCPYSARAKRLLGMYDLSPAPRIVEVDLRPDGLHIKTLLTRLTHRSTFPNVILHGHSLGGSDDLVRLHEEDRLRQVLEAGGVRVTWAGGDGISVWR